MAILQSRMIALINAALDYRNALNQLTKMIHKEAINIQAGTQTPAGAFQTLAIMANKDILLEDASLSESTIMAEHYHFHKNQRKNEWNREYQAQQALKQGRSKQKTHYEPIYATEELSQIARRSTPFPIEGQDRIQANIQKPHSTDPDQTGVSADTKREIEREIENKPSDLTSEQLGEYKAFLKRRDEEAHRRSIDIFDSSLNREVDPNFPTNKRGE